MSDAVVSDKERRALEELKKLLVSPPPPSSSFTCFFNRRKPVLATNLNEEFSSSSIWGVPLLKDGDERSDVILLKFLQDHRFNPNKAFKMIQKTLNHRKDYFGIDNEASFGGDDDLGDAFFVRGRDKKGRPVCYLVLRKLEDSYSEFNDSLDESEKMMIKERFVKSWIIYQERIVRKVVDFRPGCLNSVLLVNDFAGIAPQLVPEIGHLAALFSRNYPKSLANMVYVDNILGSTWFSLPFCTYIKCFVSGTSSTILFRYISPEQVPVEYGGLSVAIRDDAIPLFSIDDSATQSYFGPCGTTKYIEILQDQKCVIVWELRVCDSISHISYYFAPEPKDDVMVKHNQVELVCVRSRVLSGYFEATSRGTLVINVYNHSETMPQDRTQNLIYRHKQLPYTQGQLPFECRKTGKLFTRVTILG